MLHALGHLWHQFADAYAGDIRAHVGERTAGGRAGLGIPCFQLAGTAGEPEKYHAFVGVLERLVQAGLSEGIHRRTGTQPSGAHRADASEKRAPAEIMLSRAAEVVARLHKFIG